MHSITDSGKTMSAFRFENSILTCEDSNLKDEVGTIKEILDLTTESATQISEIRSGLIAMNQYRTTGYVSINCLKFF